MSSWTIEQSNGFWVGRIGVLGNVWYGKVLVSDEVFKIMPATFPYELAVDALLDFMSRVDRGPIPAWVESPEQLMELCVKDARRQR